MPKKVINITLKTSNEIIQNKLNGVISDECIKYKEKDIIVIIEKYNKKITMTRSNLEYQLKLVFENNKNTYGEYILKGNNNKFKLDIYTSLLNIKDNMIEIEYKLNDEIRYFKLNIEE